MLLLRYSLLLLTFCVINSLQYKTIIDVLSEDERFQTLIGHIQRNRLVQYINSLESATLFAPDNDAFKRTDIKITKDVLLYHLMGSLLSVNDIHHGQLIDSMYINGYLPHNASQKMKMTIDNHKMYINGARIIREDVQVNNKTTIHVIDRVLEPPALLGHSIQRNPTLYQLMQTTAISDLLDTHSPFTVFLTTQSNPLIHYNPIEYNYMTSIYGISDLSIYLQYSIINSTVYLDDIENDHTVTYESIIGNPLTISKSKDGHCTINQMEITQSDILAANGVLHELKDVFVPDMIEFTPRKYLYGVNATRYVELVDNYRMGHYLDTLDSPYTFLAPPNDALPTNAPFLSRSWLRYHVMNGTWTPDQLKDNQLLTTEYASSELNGAHQLLPVSIEETIHFGGIRVTGEHIMIHNSVIYQLIHPLTLPGDILHELMTDIEVSTFIATLYVSEVVDEIKTTPGITLFVPTNNAFQNMGLVAKYLVHSTAKDHLQTVLRYHAVDSLLYYDDMTSSEHNVSTLANSTLRIYQNKDVVMVGQSDNVSGAVIEHNALVSNGVVHKITEVQIPPQVVITNHHLLTGIDATTITHILEKASLLDTINMDDMVVLAPSEKAFAHIDIDALLNDPYELERMARLHIIPRPWQDRWIEEVDHHHEYPTLLSDVDTVYIKENEKGELFVEVKDGKDNQAHVLGLGRVSAGGGVMSIDAVLIPVRRGFFGLPWMWSIVVILIIAVSSTSVVSLCGFIGYKIYSRRRLGYRPIE